MSTVGFFITSVEDFPTSLPLGLFHLYVDVGTASARHCKYIGTGLFKYVPINFVEVGRITGPSIEFKINAYYVFETSNSLHYWNTLLEK